MSALIETREEYAKRLQNAKLARQSSIESQVQAYRAQLEAVTDSTEINELQEVIDSLDKVIAFENSSSATEYAKTEAQPVAGRVGMATVVSPERR